jgi:hypothetical protein
MNIIFAVVELINFHLFDFNSSFLDVNKGRNKNRQNRTDKQKRRGNDEMSKKKIFF